MSAPSEGAPARILVVMPNWLGDALFATPALRALRKAHPRARIECAAPARCEQALRRNPSIDELHLYDERVRWSRPLAAVRLARLFAKGRYDSVVFLGASFIKTAVAAFWRVPVRVGPAKTGKGRFLTVDAGPVDPGAHRIDQYLRIAEAAGARPDGRTLDLVPDPDARERAQRLTAEVRANGRRYAVVHAGGNWDLKRWPAASFRQWLEAYLTRTSDAIVLCGTQAEGPLIRRIAAGISSERVLDLAGRTDLSELAWILRDAEFLLTNDSGPMHVAASQNTPIVGLFGPTSPALTGPVTPAPSELLRVDVGCEVPCYYRACDRRVCMEWIETEAVLDACLRLRASRGRP